MSEEYGSPWRARMFVAVIGIVLVIAGVYGYTRFISPSREIARLEETLKSNPDAMARAGAARQLSEMKGDSVVRVLQDALRDETPHVRSAAAAGLGKVGAKSAGQALLEAIKDKEPSVRESAATALGLVKDSAAVQPLIELFKDKSDTVRRAAVFALARLGDPSAIDPIEKLGKTDKDANVKAAAKEVVVFLKTGQWPAGPVQ